MTKHTVILFVFVGVMLCAVFAQDTNLFRPYYSQYDPFHPMVDLRFEGSASGGGIVLSTLTPGGSHSLGVMTRYGESAETVVRRVVDLCNRQAGWRFQLSKDGKAIKGVDLGIGGLVLGGNEHGLGIPAPPTSLTGVYHPETGKIIVRWANPPSGYDAINGFGRICYSNETQISGRCYEPLFAAMMRLRVPHAVTGYRGSTPSATAFINVFTNWQEELVSAPFFCGIMPNWNSWTGVDGKGITAFEQGERKTQGGREFPRTPDEKAYYQIVKTKTTDVQAGIWRKWLGLYPGHKYRVYVRLNTLAMDQKTNDWSLSFHVAAADSKGTDFTTDQLTGKTPLPDGSQGPEAARIALYGPGKTTKGQWVTNTVDIVMPPGVDTLTTWLRHSGKDSTGVGMDWIKVEDLSYKPTTNALPLKPSQPSGGLDGH